jgi:hypothetical protein
MFQHFYKKIPRLSAGLGGGSFCGLNLMSHFAVYFDGLHIGRMDLPR